MAVKKEKIGSLDVYTVPGDPDGCGIVLFHGFGADATDLLPLSEYFHLEPRPTWYFPNGTLEVAIGQGYTGRAWFPINFSLLQRASQVKDYEILNKAFSEELISARGLADTFLKNLPIPFSKLYLGGFSQGAVLATDVAFHSFENPAGLILLSSTLVRKDEWKKLAHLRKGIHFFQSHGENDPLLPFGQAKELEKLLLDAGLKGKLHPFSGGHEITQKVLKELAHFLEANIVD